ncbi:translation initiation factor IF-2-like [Pipra filicauda]|uniref:Translation initiation factor IF-2-like n=1 Tax=Pipra filicauda TaxID=649802 RepID=A0A7R5KGM1_9PASS|nr:translation initiation factor IF-2-like [Pipra filicauda]
MVSAGPLALASRCGRAPQRGPSAPAGEEERPRRGCEAAAGPLLRSSSVPPRPSCERRLVVAGGERPRGFPRFPLSQLARLPPAGCGDTAGPRDTRSRRRSGRKSGRAAPEGTRLLDGGGSVRPRAGEGRSAARTRWRGREAAVRVPPGVAPRRDGACGAAAGGSAQQVRGGRRRLRGQPTGGVWGRNEAPHVTLAGRANSEPFWGRCQFPLCAFSVAFFPPPPSSRPPARPPSFPPRVPATNYEITTTIILVIITIIIKEGTRARPRGGAGGRGRDNGLVERGPIRTGETVRSQRLSRPGGQLGGSERARERARRAREERRRPGRSVTKMSGAQRRRRQ